MTAAWASNSWVVKHLRDLPMLRKELGQLERKQKRLAHQIEVRREKIKLLERCGEVYEGVAIYDWGEGDHHKFGVVAGGRWADVYPNAHNKGETYGAHIGTHGVFWPGRGKWLGAQHDYETAVRLAKQWVAHGIEPEGK